MIKYRKAECKDLNQVAKIHKEQFSSHYLGQFSLSLLRLFYENLLNANHIFIVADDKDRIMGFVVGGDWERINSSLNSFMKRYFIRSFIESMVRPKTWKKSIDKIISLFVRKKADTDNLDSIEKFTLLSIATKKYQEGKGVGSCLVAAFEKELVKLSNRYYLTVQKENKSAIKFYKKLGFVEARDSYTEKQFVKEI